MPRVGDWERLISVGFLMLATAASGQAPVRRPGLRALIPPPGQRANALSAVPSGPLTQVPMDQIPATAPQVSYQDGMLTIVAQNASLGDILREVHTRTGATIEVPPNATERVVTRLGPGPARDVLADLLNGSVFNYIMMGTEADPSSLASVTLTTKSGGAASQTAATAYQPPPQYTPQQAMMAPGAGPGGPVAQPAAGDEEDADAEDKDDEDNADQDQAQGSAAVQDGAQPNAGPKTPEQILEMLRKGPAQAVPGQSMVPRPNQPPPDPQQQ